MLGLTPELFRSDFISWIKSAPKTITLLNDTTSSLIHCPILEARIPAPFHNQCSKDKKDNLGLKNHCFLRSECIKIKQITKIERKKSKPTFPRSNKPLQKISLTYSRPRCPQGSKYVLFVYNNYIKLRCLIKRKKNKKNSYKNMEWIDPETTVNGRKLLLELEGKIYCPKGYLLDYTKDRKPVGIWKGICSKTEEDFETGELITTIIEPRYKKLPRNTKHYPFLKALKFPKCPKNSYFIDERKGDWIHVSCLQYIRVSSKKCVQINQTPTIEYSSLKCLTGSSKITALQKKKICLLRRRKRCLHSISLSKYRIGPLRRKREGKIRCKTPKKLDYKIECVKTQEHKQRRRKKKKRKKGKRKVQKRKQNIKKKCVEWQINKPILYCSRLKYGAGGVRCLAYDVHYGYFTNIICKRGLNGIANCRVRKFIRKNIVINKVK